MMKFTLSTEQYSNVMRSYSPAGELDGRLALSGLQRDYDIVFTEMALPSGYVFQANSPEKYVWFILKYT